MKQCRAKIARLRQDVVAAQLSDSVPADMGARELVAQIRKRSVLEGELEAVEKRMTALDKKIATLASRLHKSFPAYAFSKTPQKAALLPRAPGARSTPAACRTVAKCNAEIEMLMLSLRMAKLNTRREAVRIRSTADFKALKEAYKERNALERKHGGLEGKIKKQDAIVQRKLRKI